MARVPEIKSNQIANKQFKQVAMSGARSHVKATADDFGAGVARSMAGLAQTGMDVANRLHKEKIAELEETAQAQAKDATRTLMDFEMETVGSHSEKSGRDAYDSMETHLGGYQKKRNELASTLKSARARQLFKEQTESRGQFIRARIEKHGRASFKNWQADQSNALIARYSDDAVQFGFEDGVIDREKISGFTKLGIAEIEAMAEREGWAPAVQDRHVEAYKSQIHNNVIARLVGTGDFTTAQKYYNANKDRVSGTHRGTIEATLKDGLTNQNALETSEKIWTSTGVGSEPVEKDPDTATRSVDDRLETALKGADKIEDKDTRDRVKLNILEKARTQKKAEQEAAEKAFAEGQKSVLEGKNPNLLPAETKRQMGSEKFKGLVEQHKTGDDRKTTPEGYKAMYALFQEKDAAELAKRNPDDLRHMLSSNDFKIFKSYISAAKSTTAGKPDGDLSPINDNVRDYLLSSLQKIEPGPDRQDAALQGRLMLDAGRALSLRSAQKGGPLTTEEEQDTINRMFMQIPVHGPLKSNTSGRSAIPLYQVDEAGEVPPAFRKAATRAFVKKYNRNPAEHDIAAAFRTYQLSRGKG